jgi:hypothetical protein
LETRKGIADGRTLGAAGAGREMAGLVVGIECWLRTRQHRGAAMTDKPPYAAKPETPISILAEKDQTGYRLVTGPGQLEQIGNLLRGKQKFSFFYSIGLPVLVTLATVAFTTAIQYISWLNSIRLQVTTDQASRAASVYDILSTNIGDRYYSIFIFIPSLMDTVNRIGTDETGITKLTSSLYAERMSSYYEQLKRWEQSYDQMLASVDFNLDRPILLPIKEVKEKNLNSNDTLNKIDCSQSIINQMDRLGLSKHSLKAQFAILNHCFGVVTEKLDSYNSKTIADDKFRIDAKMKQDMENSQGNLNAMCGVL